MSRCWPPPTASVSLGTTYTETAKRIGFLALVTFLGVNGYDFEATDAEVIAEMLALADGRVSEDELAQWIRKHSTK